MGFPELNGGENSNDLSEMSLGRLCEIALPSDLITEARSINHSRITRLFRGNKFLNDRLVVATLVQLAKYKLNLANDPNAVILPSIVKINHIDDFATIFNGIGNILVATGGREAVVSPPDLSLDIDPRELAAAAIRSLGDREELGGSQRTLSRFLLFNAAANLALANWMIEAKGSIEGDQQVIASRVEHSKDPLFLDQFEPSRKASRIIDQFLVLDLPFQGIVDVEIIKQPVIGEAQVYE